MFLNFVEHGRFEVLYAFLCHCDFILFLSQVGLVLSHARFYLIVRISGIYHSFYFSGLCLLHDINTALGDLLVILVFLILRCFLGRLQRRFCNLKLPLSRVPRFFRVSLLVAVPPPYLRFDFRAHLLLVLVSDQRSFLSSSGCILRDLVCFCAVAFRFSTHCKAGNAELFHNVLADLSFKRINFAGPQFFQFVRLLFEGGQFLLGLHSHSSCTALRAWRQLVELVLLKPRTGARRPLAGWLPPCSPCCALCSTVSFPRRRTALTLQPSHN